MRTIRFDAAGREASVLALGIATLPSADPPERVWDRFLGAGGTTFDAAWHYGAENERRLGAWLESRGVRERVVLIGKGAHTPHCKPQDVDWQLEESLARLRTDTLDVYLLHRDDPAVAPEAWAEALAGIVADGRARAVGVSNWTTARVQALADAAAAIGLHAPAAVSNQLSLARMLEPPWDGCLSAREPGLEDWLERTQTPVVAWSSQARGWFGGRGPDEETARCWQSPGNEQRRRRAAELAAARGVAVPAVAVAWVLARPYPTVAVCSPRSLPELERLLPAATIELDAATLAALDTT